jgi:hypothetical protein
MAHAERDHRFRTPSRAAIDDDGVHALVFPCRRSLGGWMDAVTKHQVAVDPSHNGEFEVAVERRGGY